MSRHPIVAAIVLAAATAVNAQTIKPDAPTATSTTVTTSPSSPIVKSADGLWFMYFDSSQSKSTIIEFDDFIVMIEAPVNERSSGGVLKEHAAEGEKAIGQLKEFLPGKPLRYLIHSHWHTHSISAVRPFLEAGTTLITTRKNFDRLREFVDSATARKYADRITFVDADSLAIEAPGNSVIAYRFTQEEFPSSPTADYLYCYLPRYNRLHCACMYNKWSGEPVEGKELLTGREEDLHRFLATRNLKPEYLIRSNKEKKEPNELQPAAGLESVVAGGISAAKLSERFLALNEATIQASRDSVLRSVISGNIPTSVINRAVYTALGSGDLPKALRLAHLQALAGPSDANVWDTLAEVYYEAGDTVMARSYGKQAKLISPAFEGGGEEGWKKSIAERRAKAAKGK